MVIIWDRSQPHMLPGFHEVVRSNNSFLFYFVGNMNG